MDNEKMIKSIRKLCKDNGITPTKLEEDLGYSQGLISRWKDKTPAIDKIVDIAKYFKVSLDEVIGYNIVDDCFINSLIDATEKKRILWDIFDYDKEELSTAHFIDINMYNTIVNSNLKKIDENSEIILKWYYAQFNDGYFFVLGEILNNNICYPEELTFFIKANDDAYIIYQNYTKEELLPLWNKILYQTGNNAVDNLRSEDLKRAFVLNQSKLNSNAVLGANNKAIFMQDLSTISDVLEKPGIKKVIETFNKPEFQKMQETFSSPEFQKTLEIANKLQQFYSEK